MMKKILFFLIFTCISSQSFSAVGDLYYCEMTQAIELKEDKLIQYIPQKFKFTILEDNLIRFGMDANYFRGIELEIIEFIMMVSNSMVKVLSILMATSILQM